MATDPNVKLHDSKDWPRIEIVDAEGAVKFYGGTRMLIAPPIDYDNLMRQVPQGKLTTTQALRETLAKRYGADYTCPLTAGIFINLAAKASETRSNDHTPYWRTLKAQGELNDKYPGGAKAQKAKLEAEGFTILAKGRTKLRYFVQNYEKYLITHKQ